MQALNRNRSRSPVRSDFGRRRDNRMDGNKIAGVVDNNTGQDMNMMMMNQMQYGNVMMGGMFQNMMMPGAMMSGGMMPSNTGIDMMSTTGMEMMPQNMDLTAMGTTPIAAAPLASSQMAPTGTMDINMMGGMMMDPSMLGMYGMAGGDIAAMQEKKEITLKHCKLIPPEPGTPQPPHRARPPGCRTIFVGGLPDKIRESTVREIFENYGRIHTLRLSKKNFCHIRFDRESCVDAAMGISGYRIKLIDTKEKEADDMDEDDDSHATTGWLHVDYAASRDDQNEFERRQRQALRIQQQQMQQMTAQQEEVSSRPVSTHRRSPSPLRVQPYSTTAVVQLSEKIKSEEQFAIALPTLLAWLERGECSKRNANQFYSMIQATNSHIRRLFNEKMQSEEELQECKERIKNHVEGVINQLEQVAKVFSAAAHQRVWDHFTKPQRKNIETWQKMTQEFNTLKEEFNEKFNVGEEDLNGMNNKPLEMGGGHSSEEVQQLKRENESLQFQLEAYKNEVDVIKSDAKKEMEKFKAQFIARQALQGAMQSTGDSNNPPLPVKPVSKPPPPPPLPDDDEVNLLEMVEPTCGEAKLIGVMSAFLQVHPQGASLDYVVSYVRALFPQTTQATVHHVLQKHTDVFQRNTSGVGANIEHRWSFIAFVPTAPAKKEEAP